MLARRWRFLILVLVIASLVGLYYYSAIWQHRVIIVEWHSSPVYTLPESAMPVVAAPALEPGETFLFVTVRRRMNDARGEPSEIALLCPDGAMLPLISFPEERGDAAGRRFIDLVFIARQSDVGTGALKLKYLDEDAVTLPAASPQP